MLLFAGTGVRCLFVAHTQGSLSTTVAALALGVGCLAVAATVALTDMHADSTAGWVLVAVLIAVTTTLVAFAPTPSGALLRAIPYPWSALYAALFMSRRIARAMALLTAAAFAVAIVIAGFPHLIPAWVLTTATVLVVTAATSSLVEALRAQSEADPLTGLANRAGFLRLGLSALNISKRLRRTVAILVCDLDGLKLVNDRDGHAAGDDLLRTVAAAWKDTLRTSDVFARLGGDEFAVLLPDADATRAAQTLVRMRLATPAAFSAGIAVGEPNDSLDYLLARADAAMYANKTARRSGPALPAQRGYDITSGVEDRSVIPMPVSPSQT